MGQRIVKSPQIYEHPTWLHRKSPHHLMKTSSVSALINFDNLVEI